jgi:hypothetical protein
MVTPRLVALTAGLLVVAVTSLAIAKGPPVVSVTNRRFDHARHASSSSAAGKPVGCNGCHDDGKPGAEHQRCSGCHQFPSSCSVMRTPGVAGPARVCRSCHIATRPDCLPGDLPPLPRNPSFGARFTHTKHLGIGPSIDRDCGLCHRAQVPNPPTQKAHTLCSGCHNPNGARPTMTECAGCHVNPASLRTGPPPAPGDGFRIASFDHRAHTAASSLTACSSCHDTPAGDVPRPSMLGCQTRCHDGKKAFSATGTHCTICHKASAPAPATRNDQRFLHAEHARRNVQIDDCGACHVSDADGVLAVPLSRKDHVPCSNAGCHQNEYLARQPRICGVCHDSAAPWAKLAARPLKRTHPEWFEAMNHAIHLTMVRAASCEGCHGDKRTGGEAPDGHRACVSCHGHGAPPAMTDCKACHSSARQARIGASEWSVGGMFQHTTHATDPRSHRATACVTCHTQVAAARDMSQVTAPRMADCDGCHDGTVAFKTTGFGCARCHGKKVQAMLDTRPALPPSRGLGSLAPPSLLVAPGSALR